MNEQLIEQRFNKIEEKIDKLTEILTQTQIQEHRLEQCEKTIDDIKERVHVLERGAGDTALKVAGIIGTGIVTMLLGYIAVKLGIKF